MIKEVKTLSPIIYYNKHHDRNYFDNKGALVITLFSGKQYILDLTSRTDITEATQDYIKLVKTKETEEKIIFRNRLKKEI